MNVNSRAEHPQTESVCGREGLLLDDGRHVVFAQVRGLRLGRYLLAERQRASESCFRSQLELTQLRRAEDPW